MNIKVKVARMLNEYPETRDCDQTLTLYIWLNFHRDKLFKDENGKWCVRFKNILELPREDAVKRWRAKFNEPSKEYPKGRWRSTNPAVMKKRKQMEDWWLAELGYTQETFNKLKK